MNESQWPGVSPDKRRAWSRLGQAPPAGLVEARLQAHYACQFVSAFGEAYIRRREDFSHLGMTLGNTRHALLSGVALGPRRVRMAMDFPRFELYALEPGGEYTALDRFNLMGATLESVSKWMRRTAARFGFDPETLRLDFAGLPEHPLRRGGAFSYNGGEADMEELGRYFFNAAAIMSQVCSSITGCSLIHVWPGHFDINAIYSFVDNPGAKHTIGIGLCPGDAYLAEPYFYANIFPPPDSSLLPAAPAPGIWRKEGRWTGTALSASEIVKLSGADEQMALTEKFLAESVAILRGL